MAVAYDNSSNSGSLTGSSTSFSHTTSGSGRLLLVGVYQQSGSVSSITYNGVALTSLATTSLFGAIRMTVYYLLAPASGSNTVAVTLSGSTNFGVIAESFTGAGGVGTAVTSTSLSGTTRSVSVTTAYSNSIVADFIGVNADTAITVGSGQTQRQGFTVVSSDTFRASTEVDGTPSSVTMDWTAVDSSQVSSQIAVEVNGISGTSTLIDNFDDNSIDTAKWTSYASSATVAETGQGVVVTLAGSTGGSNYAGLYSVNQYNLTSDYTQVRVTTVPNPATGAQAIFKVQKDNNNVLVFAIAGGTLYYQKNVAGGGYTNIDTDTYSATDHRYLRLREASGTTYFDTSPDSITWTNRASLANPFAITEVTQEVSGGTYQSETSPGTVRFDNFNYPTLTGSVSMTGDASFSAIPYASYFASVTMTGSAIFFAQGTLEVAQGEIDRKTYIYKVFDADGVYLGTWDDVVSELTFSHEINSAGSAVEVELGRNSDTQFLVSYDNLIAENDDNVTSEADEQLLLNIVSGQQIGSGSMVYLNYNVEIYVFYGTTAYRITQDGDIRITEGGDTRVADDGAVNGKLIFTGYISRYVSRYGPSETTLVTLFSYGAELDNYMLEDVSNTTLTYNSYDPSNILYDVIDKYSADGGVINYDAESIQSTGTEVSYAFNTNTTLEAVKKCLELAPTDWSFYLDMAENILHFFARPTAVAHTFVLGKHIYELNLEQNIEDLKNIVYFSGGDTGGGVNLFTRYEDATSVTDWRQGIERYSDNRVTVQGSADIISESILDRKKDPQYRSSITILSETYDTENIKLGQLVSFANFNNFIDNITLQIVRLDYTPDAVTLQLDTLLPAVSKRVEDIKRNLDAQETIDNPTAPV